MVAPFGICNDFMVDHEETWSFAVVAAPCELKSAAGSEVLAGRDVLESHLGCCKGSPGEVGQQRLSHSWPWFFDTPGIL